MTTEWNVKVPMRDGTLLAADVWRGADGERRTTLLARTPYNKNTAEQQERYLKPLISGERRICFAMTERAAGSDATS